MASSEVDICNIALGRIGVKAWIESLNGSSEAARACKVYYGHSRDAVLSAFPWPFATRRATLAAASGVTYSGWSYAYALPSDFLHAQHLWMGSRSPRVDERAAFALESTTSSGRVLISDLEDAELVYTARVEVVTSYPPLFVEALAWKLAADLAMPLSAKRDLAIAARAAYPVALNDAAAASLRGEAGEMDPESELISVRG